MEFTNEKFTRTLKMLRREFGLTQAKISSLLGIKRTAYTYYEANPCSVSLLRLLNYLYSEYGVTPNDLFFGAETSDLSDLVKKPDRIVRERLDNVAHKLENTLSLLKDIREEI